MLHWFRLQWNLISVLSSSSFINSCQGFPFVAWRINYGIAVWRIYIHFLGLTVNRCFMIKKTSVWLPGSSLNRGNNNCEYSNIQNVTMRKISVIIIHRSFNFQYCRLWRYRHRNVICIWHATRVTLSGILTADGVTWKDGKAEMWHLNPSLFPDQKGRPCLWLTAVA